MNKSLVVGNPFAIGKRRPPAILASRQVGTEVITRYAATSAPFLCLVDEVFCPRMLKSRELNEL